MQSNCTECGFKKSRFVKEQEAKGLPSNLGIKTPGIKMNEMNARNAFKTTWFYLQCLWFVF